jgi:hypothetical protein
VRAIDGLLYLIKAEPSLCDPVLGGGDRALLMQHRAHDELHTCLACGRPSNTSLIAETQDGDRWLDVCWDHYAALAAPDMERPPER